MSDVDYDEDGNSIEKNDGPKALRDQLKKLQKQHDELVAERDSLLAAKRTGDLASILEKAGAKAQLAKYAQKDLGDDITEESVTKWLESDGELFGWQPPGSDDGVEDVAARDQQAISRASSQAPAPPSGLTPEVLRTMTFEQLIAAGHIQP